MTRTITIDTGENEFQVRLFKDEGVGLLTTKNDKNYLILDSIDYWYDLIQTEYPQKKKCSCKNEWFNVQFNYISRIGTNDIREVQITTICTNCSKTGKPISIDIDYSPTDQLISMPLTFCEKPNIKYKFSELTSYWSGNDLNNLLKFVFFDLKLNVYCWYSKLPEKKRFFEKVSFEMAIQIITINYRYLNFYFSPYVIDISRNQETSDENGVYVEDGIWRRNEIIQLSSPFIILGYGLLYYINFCNQYLEKGNIKDKSDNFERVTNELRNWLKVKFITKRGSNCFDGEEAYNKFMAKRNTEK